MTTVRIARLLGFLLLAGCLQAASPLRPAMDAVEKIRGRQFTADVKNLTIDRADLQKHLREQMVKGLPYSLDDWGTVLRSLQLVDAEPETILPQLLSLYESQVLAFYDPHTHTYYSIKQLPKLPENVTNMADPEMLEETVMVHELMHALQDQHFNLAQKEKTLMRDTDANVAYHAVLEGEAVLVMIAHMLNKSGIDLDEVVTNEAMLNTITSASAAEQMIDPSTPKFFAEMLKFPYLEGFKFVVAAYRKGGWKELDKVHANPPRSTREILHPEEYFARTFKAEKFDAAKPAGNVIAVEHMGEFGWRFLVGEQNARGWVNDRVAIWRDGKVEAQTKWESPERAAAFADAYGAFLKKRGLAPDVVRDGVNVTVKYTAK
jgi:hypothetical protein